MDEMVSIELSQEKCIECKTCIKTCPMGVYEEGEDSIVVSNPENCIICHACEAACPAEAINITE